MTRKDYIAIGEAVAKVVGHNIAWEEYRGKLCPRRGDRSQLVSEIGSQLLHALSHTFKEDNERFDRARFADFFNEKEEEARAEKEERFFSPILSEF